jgi:hypothetical protein
VDSKDRAADQTEETTAAPQVGDEGGGPGDVETGTSEIGTGSEAGELWRPADQTERQIIRDEDGEGRRTP